MEKILSGKKVAVTGGSGFIGGRLIERLVLEQGADVTALVRNYSGCARIARFPIPLAKVDLENAADLSAALKGVSAVFHCAYGFDDFSANLRVAAALADACIATGTVLVHTSTISVYEPLSDGPLNETSPLPASDNAYGLNKRAIETLLLAKAREAGLKLVIVQPTIVYGPFSRIWTDGPLKRLATGFVVLPDGGEGLCNPVHVDDVCQGMMLAAAKSEALDGRFLLSGPESVTWRAFYTAYGQMLGQGDAPHLRYAPYAEIAKNIRSPIGSMKVIIANPKHLLNWGPTKDIVLKIVEGMGEGTRTKIKAFLKSYRKVAPDALYYPDADLLTLYGAKCRVSIGHARDTLGYSPDFSFERGMAVTARYVKWAFPPDIRAKW